MSEPKMVCPICYFVPEIDRRMPPGSCDPPEAFRGGRTETDRWLEYVAHLLEHLVMDEAGSPKEIE